LQESIPTPQVRKSRNKAPDHGKYKTKYKTLNFINFDINELKVDKYKNLFEYVQNKPITPKINNQ